MARTQRNVHHRRLTSKVADALTSNPKLQSKVIRDPCIRPGAGGGSRVKVNRHATEVIVSVTEHNAVQLVRVRDANIVAAEQLVLAQLQHHGIACRGK